MHTSLGWVIVPISLLVTHRAAGKDTFKPASMSAIVAVREEPQLPS